jgi:hypothetical protein
LFSQDASVSPTVESTLSSIGTLPEDNGLSEELKQEVASAITFLADEIEKPGTADLVRAHLADMNRIRRTVCAIALAHSGRQNDEVITTLVQSLELPFPGKNIFAGIVRYDVEAVSSCGVKAIEIVFQNPCSAASMLSKQRALLGMRPRKDVLSAVSRYLESSDDSHRTLAIEVLRGCGELSVDYLEEIGMLLDERTPVRTRVISAIEYILAASIRTDVDVSRALGMSFMPHFDGDLSIYDTAITDEGLKSISNVRELRGIHLPRAVTDEGLKQLSENRKLERILVSGPHISRRGIQTLSSLPEITFLAFRDTPQIGNSVFPALRSMKNLRKLDLSGTAIDDDGAVEISSLNALEVLELPRLLTNDGLARIGKMPSLMRLSLWSTRVTGEGISHLIEHRSVRILSLPQGTTDDAIPYLNRLKWLTELCMIGTQFTEEGEQRLRNALPKCHFDRICDFSDLGRAE